MTAIAPLPTPQNDAAALTDEAEAPKLVRGTVITCDGNKVHVRAGQRRIASTTATSCLVAPEPGDQVLLAAEGEREGWILAVLDRPGQQRLHIALGEDAEIAATGNLRITADDTLDLVARQQTRLTTRTLSLSAKVAEAAIDQVTAVGANLHTHFAGIRTLAKQLDVVADRVVERLKNRYQFIEHSDQLRAEHVDLRAEKTMSLRGEHTVVTAREVVKVDGDQIHVG